MAQAGLTMAQLAVAWVLQNPNVSPAIVGTTVLGPVAERDPTKVDSPR